MAIIKICKSVSESDDLWRYISLDTFIHLLNSKTLYFTPLSAYEASDPYEGYLPKVALQAFSDINQKSLDRIKSQYSQLTNNLAGKNLSPAKRDSITKLEVMINGHKTYIRKAFVIISKATTVNCWHNNNVESEAMWRLYSQKGIAIKTNIELIKESLNSNTQDLTVHIGKIKYLNFHDETLKPSDCISDGHLVPLIKRSSFSHENEVRLFITPKIDPHNIENISSNAFMLDIDPKTLIKEIFISPFTSEPFDSSVYAICDQYGIDTSIIKKSMLLNGHNELLDVLDK